MTIMLFTMPPENIPVPRERDEDAELLAALLDEMQMDSISPEELAGELSPEKGKKS
jgi:hypothetical protein